MKTSQRIKILERAYDKAVKFVAGKPTKLAEMEEFVLLDALQYSAKLYRKRREEYRRSVWAHFGWDKPETKEAYNKMIEEKCYGRSSTIRVS